MYNLGDLGFSDFAGSGIVHMAGAAAALAGVLLLGARKGKYGPNGEIRAFPGANMPLAGLVVITAEPSTPSALTAAIFGAFGGVLVVLSVVTMDKLRIDDPVGAISVHGVCGLLGLLLVPVTNSDVSFSGQIIGALTIFVWVFIASLVVWGIIKAVMGLRVSEEDEYEGVDLSECGMEAYPEFVSSK